MNAFVSQLTTYEFTLWIVLVLSILIQLFFYLVVYVRVTPNRSKKKKVTPSNLPPVSVVICARNEEKNLEEFLPLVLEQDYPDFEVVVVDDCSADDSDMVLKRLSARYPNLKTTAIKVDNNFFHGKKLALTVGIKAAKNSWVLLTDADCKPSGSLWLASMAANFRSPNQVVLGYGGYIETKGLLNKFIRFDTFFIAMQYMGFALFGKPYMGVGRNLAYTKDIFFKNKGFARYNHIASGDDDLFVQKVARSKNTTVEYCLQSHTRSVACTTFKQWAKQKRRHLTTAPLYRGGIKFWLGLEPVSRLLFWASGIILLTTSSQHIEIVAGAMALRVLVMLIIVKIVMIRLSERKIFLFSLVYDILSPIVIGTLVLANSVTKKRIKWN
ncbi:MAG: glycosyltransferase [Bacteroidales bacterium]|nr:glycosyltransferase [Bacteroidales bacterium]